MIKKKKKKKKKQIRRDKVREWLMQPNNNFCSLPYAHMAIEANGAIHCCMGKPPDVNISGGTIADAFTSKVRPEFVDSFDRNEQHESQNMLARPFKQV